MIAAYIGSALLSAGVYLTLRCTARKKGLLIGISIFLVLCAAFTVWFINTGGYYGVIGTNGIDPDWARK
ncbi:hypothetical protein U2P60_07385 [Brucella sp. H1_1004]|uniref:hypothetical protein n=1 Tax=Brucella sp. H1_1004 TaxID=3110109 RepID=UPI0039B6CD1F